MFVRLPNIKDLAYEYAESFILVSLYRSYDFLYVYPRTLRQINVIITYLDCRPLEICTVNKYDLTDFAGIKADGIEKICVDDVVKEGQDHLGIVFLEAFILKH